MSKLSIYVRFWPFHLFSVIWWNKPSGLIHQGWTLITTQCKSTPSANRHLHAFPSALTGDGTVALASSPATSLQRPQKKSSLLLKVWEGIGCKMRSPSLLKPLPVLGKHTSVRYHLKYQVIITTGFSTLNTTFWVVVKGLFYGIIFLNNGIDVHFKMLQMILMNTDIREIPPTRYDPFYLLCVMRLLPFNSIHSLLLVCYMHTCMCVCGSVTWMCVHMCVFVTQLW